MEVQPLVISFWVYEGKVMRMMTVILKILVHFEAAILAE